MPTEDKIRKAAALFSKITDECITLDDIDATDAVVILREAYERYMGDAAVSLEDIIQHTKRGDLLMRFIKNVTLDDLLRTGTLNKVYKKAAGAKPLKAAAVATEAELIQPMASPTEEADVDTEEAGLIVPDVVGEPTREESDEEAIEIGQWYWVKVDADDYDDHIDERVVAGEMLMCVTHVGTNYVQLGGVTKGRNYNCSRRVHMDKWDETCRREHDFQDIIRDKVNMFRGKTKELMLEVKKITARLGVAPAAELTHSHDTTDALVAVSTTESVTTYKQDLIKAKTESLPKLFERIKESNEKMAVWMTAETIPMEAMSAKLQGSIGRIEDRIFNVELYAGLTEQVVHVRKGDEPHPSTKLHVFQRRHYMDEECLINYRHGGMNFQDITEFDTWMAEDENMMRILPFERCMVAFRIRRTDEELSLNTPTHIRFWHQKNNVRTFMYIRNGENLHRMDSSIDFGKKIFPDNTEFDPQRLWVDTKFGRVSNFIHEDEYMDRKAETIRHRKEDAELDARFEAWQEKNPDVERKDYPEEFAAFRTFRNHHHNYFRYENYVKFNRESVYYDDMNDNLEKQLKEYNRISLVIQGLYDRSPVFMPHPPVRLWEPEDFDTNLKLIFDQDRTIAPGDKPDFEAYRTECNKHFKLGALTIGQEHNWMEHEAKKECDKRDRSYYRSSNEWMPELFAPHGNPGPGYIAEITKHTRTGKCTFRWNRERQTGKYDWMGRRSASWGDPIPCTFTVHEDDLFCVDGYKLGDFKQFFEDPRTRAEYFKWAPLLFAAEEYHYGLLKEGESTASECNDLPQ